ncbi:ADP-ribosylglycohydrolase family protein [Amnibacterium kyonggiense]|uniref:ADP-ribosylglycohydrolase n=1 Tax=Amnibacterium kyonggiense TaxID=595671 RepID=A0A4R7FIV6_9MICO|nr:ADP-ribosylglycohydrolase family protein [Amnibacterium kyonggiense]TDS74842.1 ADP-ribosylglycohydrolase [Amnibacterium kyonggiense]
MSDDTIARPVELAPALSAHGYDPLEPVNLLHDEVLQRRETGYDVDAIVVRANETDPKDRRAVLDLVDAMEDAERTAPWDFEEPTPLDDIRSVLPPAPAAESVDPAQLSDRIHAAWLGRIAGCNLGKPVEWGDYWTVERIADYLRLTDSYPLTDYFVKLDPQPADFELRDNWPQTTRGNVNGSARDDDIDYAILSLHLLEQHGEALGPDDVGRAWKLLLPIEQTYTAERAAYINLVEGFRSPRTATRRNPYREWIGAQIRADVFGWVHAGDPWAAARIAYQDAALSHVANGVYGEMWSAALNAAAFVSANAEEAVRRSLVVVPPRSRLAEAINRVLALHDSGASWEEALADIRAAYGHYSWVHTINNAAAVVAALIWAEGDFTTAVGRVVMSGWDTDSNGATVGSVAGVLAGMSGLPAHLIDPLRNRTRSALFGFDDSVISDLADRTVRLAESSRG